MPHTAPIFDCPRCLDPLPELMTMDRLMEHAGRDHFQVYYYSCPKVNCHQKFVDLDLFLNHLKFSCKSNEVQPLFTSVCALELMDHQRLKGMKKFQNEAIIYRDTHIRQEQPDRERATVSRSNEFEDETQSQDIGPRRRGRTIYRLDSDDEEEKIEVKSKKPRTRSDGPVPVISLDSDESVPPSPDLSDIYSDVHSEFDEDEDSMKDFIDDSDLPTQDDEDSDEIEASEESLESDNDESQEKPTSSVRRSKSYTKIKRDNHCCEYKGCCYKKFSQLCAFCNGQHAETSCAVVTNHDERVNLYKSHKICYKCRGPHFRNGVNNCNPLRRCKFCQRHTHVAAICQSSQAGERWKALEEKKKNRQLDDTEDELCKKLKEKREERIQTVVTNKRATEPYVPRN